MRSAALAFLGLSALAGPVRAAAPPNHIVIVIEENHDHSQVIGNPAMPTVNRLAKGGLLLTDSHGVEHPSQPNYLDLFSGGNQGVTDDNPVPGSSSDPARQVPLTTPNLAAQLLRSGLSFAAFSEDLPKEGSLAYYSDGRTAYDTEKGAPPLASLYARKHNPWTNWQATRGTAADDTSSNTLPARVNRTLSDFPADFTRLPTVTFVIPNQCNDQHGGIDGKCPYGDETRLARNADDFLRDRLGAYAAWARTHNSLLIVTWDENNFTEPNHVATIVYGAGVPAGATYAHRVNHFNLLRTIEDFYCLKPIGAAAAAAPIPMRTETVHDVAAAPGARRPD